jgi:putative ABC transport system substrate-binding protein
MRALLAARALRRRYVIALLGCAAVAWPIKVRAQQSRIYRIGYLAPARIPHLIEALQQGLREFGYIEGRNLTIEYRFEQGGMATIDALAAELVQLNPDMIVTVGSPPVVAAKRATSTIPIVMATAGDPLSLGVVESLARPGGNVTGVTLFGSELSGKRVELLKEAVPGAARIAVLGNGRNVLTKLLWQGTLTATKPLGLEARLFQVQELADLPSIFSAIAQYGADGLIVLSDALFNSSRQTIVGLAAKHHLPTVYEAKDFADAGGLISYGPNIDEMTRRSAAFVDRILKGAKPADLPIQQPTKVELVINHGTARALGLIIPHGLLARADEVIE